MQEPMLLRQARVVGHLDVDFADRDTDQLRANRRHERWRAKLSRTFDSNPGDGGRNSRLTVDQPRGRVDSESQRRQAEPQGASRIRTGETVRTAERRAA
jgi:hypothetical protein